jgi:hypothetical protein
MEEENKNLWQMNQLQYEVDIEDYILNMQN